MKKIICVYGGPGSGKSTFVAGLYFKLKLLGKSCEMNREYIKDWVWEKRKPSPGDQTYYFAKQSRKERVYMVAEVDFILTDSPLILTHMYGLKYDFSEREENTSKMMLKSHHLICKHYGYKIDHFFLRRTGPYQVQGRNESEIEAKQIDKEILSLLDSMNICYDTIDSTNMEDAVIKTVEKLTLIKEGK